jgi:hypothetical protein
MLQAIGLGAEYDNCKGKGFGLILRRQILIHGEENVKSSGIRNVCEQPAVLNAAPAGLWDRHDHMAV